MCKAAGEGAQQETTSFAAWEQHTRGIASRIMARLGYVQGRALGQRGEGLTAPLQVRVGCNREGCDLRMGEKSHLEGSSSSNSQVHGILSPW